MSDQHAEQMAAAAMRGMGYPDASETPVGPDGGVDVRAARAIAQVKFKGAQTGRPDLQRLVGARAREVFLDLFFFSASGYSAKAREYAAEMDIALFVFDSMGHLTPSSPAASRALVPSAVVPPARAAGLPAEAAPVEPSPLTLWARRYWLEATTLFSAVSAPLLTIDCLANPAEADWSLPPTAAAFALIGAGMWRFRNVRGLGSNFRKL